MLRASIHFAAGLGLGLVLVLPSAPSSARDDVPADVSARSNPVRLDEQQVAYFQRQFKAKCARCHGLDGSGRGADAGTQPVPPADFTDAAYMQSRSDGQLFYQILMGGGDRCAMPAFGPGSDHSWSEEKIWQMVAFVRRFTAPEGH